MPAAGLADAGRLATVAAASTGSAALGADPPWLATAFGAGTSTVAAVRTTRDAETTAAGLAGSDPVDAAGTAVPLRFTWVASGAPRPAECADAAARGPESAAPVSSADAGEATASPTTTPAPSAAAKPPTRPTKPAEVICPPLFLVPQQTQHSVAPRTFFTSQAPARPGGPHRSTVTMIRGTMPRRFRRCSAPPGLPKR